MIRNRGRGRSGDDDDDFGVDKPVLITRDQSISNTYTVFFDDLLMEAANYSNLLTFLASATEQDIFVFRFIGCPGGDLNVALPIYNAIRNTPAQTISVLESYSCSAATMLFLASDNFVVQPGATMMVHGASYGNRGHMSYMRSSVNFSEKYIRGIFERVYKGFLTQQEIDHLLTTDYDMNLMEDEIVERLQKMAEASEAKVVEAEAPQKPVEPKKPSRATKPRNKE